MAKQFLDKHGLNTFVTQLKEKLFATKEYVAEVKTATDPYILDIDYSILEFNTDMIVSGEASSAMIGTGQLGMMILGNS